MTKESGLASVLASLRGAKRRGNPGRRGGKVGKALRLSVCGLLRLLPYGLPRNDERRERAWGKFMEIGEKR